MFINSVNQFQGGEMYAVGTKSIILFQDKRFRVNSNSMSYFTVWDMRTITKGPGNIF